MSLCGCITVEELRWLDIPFGFYLAYKVTYLISKFSDAAHFAQTSSAPSLFVPFQIASEINV